MSDKKHTRTLWRRLKKNRLAVAAMVFLFVLVLLALLAPFIANQKPLYAVYKGQTFYPAFTSKIKYTVTNPVTNEVEDIDIDKADWKQLKLESVVWPLIPYSPGRSDLVNANYISPNGKQEFKNADGKYVEMPGRFRHKLGTGVRGDDVLSGLIHGTRISLTVGILSIILASLLGILLGAAAGYFGDNSLRINRGGMLGFYVSLLPAWFYSFYIRGSILGVALSTSALSFILQLLLSLVILVIIILIISKLFALTVGRLPFFNKPTTIPFDSWLTRIIETVISIPGIILIIALAAITHELTSVVIVVIGLTGWTGIARLIRAEMLKVREMDYVVAAKASGLKNAAIIFKHALPNAIQPALVSMVFGVASAILIESGLSFLGAFQIDSVTWGSMLAEGRSNFNAWWLVVFPGLMIFLTVTSLNILGEALRDEMDVREN